MKNLFMVFSLCFVFFGCKKLDKLTQFYINNTEEVEIPPSNPLNLPFNLFSPDIETNSEAEFAVNDTRKDLIEEILLEELKLTLVRPSEGDFGFLKSVELFLSAEDLPEVKIAWATEIDDETGKILDLETSNQDFKEYIKKEKFSLRIKTVTDEIMDETHIVEIDSKYYVDAKLKK